ncbi:MAG: hypothetical protein IKF16_10965 [Lachnospiraceae bacterium]|nr:hypothetical protein [Lachnospiraceae bacterium]
MTRNKTVIDVSLSTDGIDRAIKEIRQYKRRLTGKIQRLITAMCQYGEDYAINAVGHFDTGETVNSIQGYRNGNRGVIVAGGNAIWLEFGTGVHYNGHPNGSPHPYGEQLGFRIGEYGEQHGLEQGWFYPTDDPRYEIVRKTADGGTEGTGYAYTHGIEAQMFMFKTARELERVFPELAKKVFG